MITKIEESLAARKIAQLTAQGYGERAAIAAAAQLVASQGFGKQYAQQVAEQMAALLR